MQCCPQKWTLILSVATLCGSVITNKPECVNIKLLMCINDISFTTISVNVLFIFIIHCFSLHKFMILNTICNVFSLFLNYPFSNRLVYYLCFVSVRWYIILMILLINTNCNSRWSPPTVASLVNGSQLGKWVVFKAIKCQFGEMGTTI